MGWRDPASTVPVGVRAQVLPWYQMGGWGALAVLFIKMLQRSQSEYVLPRTVLQPHLVWYLHQVSKGEDTLQDRGISLGRAPT